MAQDRMSDWFTWNLLGDDRKLPPVYDDTVESVSIPQRPSSDQYVELFKYHARSEDSHEWSGDRSLLIQLTLANHCLTGTDQTAAFDDLDNRWHARLRKAHKPRVYSRLMASYYVRCHSSPLWHRWDACERTPPRSTLAEVIRLDLLKADGYLLHALLLRVLREAEGAVESINWLPELTHLRKEVVELSTVGFNPDAGDWVVLRQSEIYFHVVMHKQGEVVIDRTEQSYTDLIEHPYWAAQVKYFVTELKESWITSLSGDSTGAPTYTLQFKGTQPRLPSDSEQSLMDVAQQLGITRWQGWKPPSSSSSPEESNNEEPAQPVLPAVVARTELHRYKRWRIDMETSLKTSETIRAVLLGRIKNVGLGQVELLVALSSRNLFTSAACAQQCFEKVVQDSTVNTTIKKKLERWISFIPKFLKGKAPAMDDEDEEKDLGSPALQEESEDETQEGADVEEQEAKEDDGEPTPITDVSTVQASAPSSSCSSPPPGVSSSGQGTMSDSMDTDPSPQQSIPLNINLMPVKEGFVLINEQTVVAHPEEQKMDRESFRRMMDELDASQGVTSLPPPRRDLRKLPPHIKLMLFPRPGAAFIIPPPFAELWRQQCPVAPGRAESLREPQQPVSVPKKKERRKRQQPVSVPKKKIRSRS